MEIENAIKTAMDYEIKIRDIYRNAAEQISDADGKRFFKMMGDDEQRHLEYLKHKLDVWQKTGELSAEKLESLIPSKALIQTETQKIEAYMSPEELSSVKIILGKALKMEIETSKFYERLVDEMTHEGQKMFARFLEIEENHIAAVQAELDYITHTGYWFDFKEFGMEEL